MTNRKLRKILKQNQINVPEKAPQKRKNSIRIPRRVIMRTAQIAACLALVCALGFGYVAMLRFVGRPGGDGGNDGPGSQLDIESTADTTRDPSADTGADVVTDEHPEDTTVPSSDGERLKIYAAGISNSVSEHLRWVEFDPINDADIDYGIDARLFARMKALDGIYDITSVYFESDGQYLSWVKNSALTGSDGAIVTGKAYFISTLAVTGLLEKIKVDDYIDEYYWPENMVEELSVGDNLYFVSGVISPNTVANTYIVYTHPEIDALLGVDIHGIVEEGKWTLDKMYELSAYGGAGLNGSADYGLVLTDETLRALGTSAGIRIASKNAKVAHSSLSDGTALNFVNNLADLLTSGKLKMTTSESSEHISQLFKIDTIASPLMHTTPTLCEQLPMPVITEGGKHLSPVSDNAIYYAIAEGTNVQTQDILNRLASYMSVPIDSVDGKLGINTTASAFFSYRYASNEKSIQSIKIAIDNMTFSLDAFLNKPELNHLLKDALNAPGERERKNILNPESFFSYVISDLGSLIN